LAGELGIIPSDDKTTMNYLSQLMFYVTLGCSFCLPCVNVKSSKIKQPKTLQTSGLQSVTATLQETVKMGLYMNRYRLTLFDRLLTSHYVGDWKRAYFKASGCCLRHNERGLKRNDKSLLYPVTLLRLWNAGGWCCIYCGARCRLRGRCAITLDHIRALAMGGDNSLFNLAPACGDCNSCKSDAPLTVWLSALGVRRWQFESRRFSLWVWVSLFMLINLLHKTD
jgi:5-methylcytosine-specific restriction endonuclease McrA